MITLGLDAKVIMATLTLISKLKICEGQVKGSTEGPPKTKRKMVRKETKGPREDKKPELRATEGKVWGQIETAA